MAAWNYIKSKKSFTSHSRRTGVYWQRKGPFAALNGPEPFGKMKLGFLRKPARDESPLVVSMTGVRLGDRAIFAGSSAELLVPLAARTGLSGQLLALGPHAVDLKTGAEREGHLVEASGDWTTLVASLLHAIRSGGRIVVVIGARAHGALAFLKPPGQSGPEVATVVQSLEQAGWQRARGIGGRDGLEFVEAVRR